MASLPPVIHFNSGPASHDSHRDATFTPSLGQMRLGGDRDRADVSAPPAARFTDGMAHLVREYLPSPLLSVASTGRRSRRSYKSYGSRSDRTDRLYYGTQSDRTDRSSRRNIKTHDTRSRRPIDARELLSSYKVIRIKKKDTSHELDPDGNSIRATWSTADHFPSSEILKEDGDRRIWKLKREYGDVCDRFQDLHPDIQHQIDIAQYDLEENERDGRYRYDLAHFERKTMKVAVSPKAPHKYSEYQSRKTKSQSRGIEKKSKSRYRQKTSKHDIEPNKSDHREKQTVSITAYFKRSPKQDQNCERMLQELEEKKEGRAYRMSPVFVASPPQLSCSHSPVPVPDLHLQQQVYADITNPIHDGSPILRSPFRPGPPLGSPEAVRAPGSRGEGPYHTQGHGPKSPQEQVFPMPRVQGPEGVQILGIPGNQNTQGHGLQGAQLSSPPGPHDSQIYGQSRQCGPNGPPSPSPRHSPPPNQDPKRSHGGPPRPPGLSGTQGPMPPPGYNCLPRSPPLQCGIGSQGLQPHPGPRISHPPEQGPRPSIPPQPQQRQVPAPTGFDHQPPPLRQLPRFPMPPRPQQAQAPNHQQPQQPQRPMPTPVSQAHLRGQNLPAMRGNQGVPPIQTDTLRPEVFPQSPPGSMDSVSDDDEESDSGSDISTPASSATPDVYENGKRGPNDRVPKAFVVPPGHHDKPGNVYNVNGGIPRGLTPPAPQRGFPQNEPLQALSPSPQHAGGLTPIPQQGLPPQRDSHRRESRESHRHSSRESRQHNSLRDRRHESREDRRRECRDDRRNYSPNSRRLESSNMRQDDSRGGRRYSSGEVRRHRSPDQQDYRENYRRESRDHRRQDYRNNDRRGSYEESRHDDRHESHGNHKRDFHENLSRTRPRMTDSRAPPVIRDPRRVTPSEARREIRRDDELNRMRDRFGRMGLEHDARQRRHVSFGKDDRHGQHALGREQGRRAEEEHRRSRSNSCSPDDNTRRYTRSKEHSRESTSRKRRESSYKPRGYRR